MSNETPKIYSDSEQLEILYSLKKNTQLYRSGTLFNTFAAILQNYSKAVDIFVANSEGNETRRQIFDRLMRPMKRLLAEEAAKKTGIGSSEIPAEFLPLFDKGKLEELKTAVAELEKNKREERELNSPAKKKAPVKKSAPKEKEDLFFNLRKVVVDYLNSPECEYSKSEKRNYLKIAEKALKLNIIPKGDNVSFSISIEGIPEVKMYVDGKGISYSKRLKTSSYPFLTPFLVNPPEEKEKKKAKIPELLKLLKKKGSIPLESSLETSRKNAEKKALQDAEAAVTAEEEKKKRLKELPEERKELQAELDKAFVEVLASIDGKALFEILTSDNPKTKPFFSLLQSADGKLQDELYKNTVDACVYDPAVWSLYKENDKEGCHDKRSYFDKLADKAAEKIHQNEELNENLLKIMEGRNLTFEECNKIIDRLAGVNMPREIAQKHFLQKVFEWGMSMYGREEFSPARFDKMNEIMKPFGYRIAMRAFVAERECSEARQISDAVLTDMKKSKSFRNKELALLYHIGQAIAGGKCELDRYNRGRHNEYERFAELYYGIPEERAATHQGCLAGWESFVKDPSKLRTASNVYNALHSLTPDKAAEEKMIADMIKGSSGLEDNLPLASGSMHHTEERRFAGLFETLEKIIKRGSAFNAKGSLAGTITAHPADDDPHYKAHLFDMKELYLYMRDGRYHKGSISGIKKGDIVFAPVVEVADASGNFAPAISRGTFLVTSQRGAIYNLNNSERDSIASKFEYIATSMVQYTKKMLSQLGGKGAGTAGHGF